MPDSSPQKRPDLDRCYEPIGMGYPVGVVVCILPRGHEGAHDGGEAERVLGEHFAAHLLEQEAEHGEW